MIPARITKTAAKGVNIGLLKAALIRWRHPVGFLRCRRIDVLSRGAQSRHPASTTLVTSIFFIVATRSDRGADPGCHCSAIP